MSMMVSVRTIINQFYSPIENPPWGCKPFSINDVFQAVENNDILDSYDYDNERINHIRRIAYFIINGWDEPIHIDVGIPALGYYDTTIDDGNHRLYAAIARKDKKILATISGQLGYAARIFRCRIKDLEEHYE